MLWIYPTPHLSAVQQMPPDLHQLQWHEELRSCSTGKASADQNKLAVRSTNLAFAGCLSCISLDNFQHDRQYSMSAVML